MSKYPPIEPAFETLRIPRRHVRFLQMCVDHHDGIGEALAYFIDEMDMEGESPVQEHGINTFLKTYGKLAEMMMLQPCDCDSDIVMMYAKKP